MGIPNICDRGLAGLLGVVAMLLSACSTAPPGTDAWLERMTAPRLRNTASESSSNLSIPLDSRDSSYFTGEAVIGDDLTIGAAIASATSTPAQEKAAISLNLLDVPIAHAAKAILGNVFRANYSVDSQVVGNVTVQTSRPVTKAELLSLFESALRANGAAIVGRSNTYRIVTTSDLGKSVLAVETAEADESARLGLRVVAVPLQYVSAEEISTVLTPLVPPGSVVRTDPARNVIMLSGSDQELAAMRETISVFDVDWMQGMSFALYPVKSAAPASVVEELDTVFGTRRGPLKGVVRFVPNQRLGAILAITSRSKYLKDAGEWIQRLDKIAASKETQLHVYNVQNRTATELARVLQSVFRTKEGERVAVESTVAPRHEPAELREPAAQEASADQAVAANADADDHEPTMPHAEEDAAVRVVADDSNNALLIVATRVEYERIRRVLDEIDAIPNQVLIEVIVAEVSLNDELKFGVRWFAGERDKKLSLTDLASGAIASAFPGFSYFFAAKDARIVLNALSSVTEVNVISSPSLVVLDNRTATLQVGDEVPVVVQSANNVTAPGAPVVNTVELKDTGVILAVTPRVNDSGRVVLDVDQEVSNVVRTTTSGIDSPTIRKRKVRTNVVISDGETLVLGGLMQERDTRGQAKVPLLGNLPLIGAAFRQRNDFIDRTELVIFIRPRVIRDLSEARAATAEFREQLSLRKPRAFEGKSRIERDVRRILSQ